MRFLLAIAAAVILSGCELMPTKVEVVQVKVPVAYVPAPPAVERPVLQSESLSPEAGYDIFVKSLESDMVRIDAYSKSLENIIKAYDDLSKQYPKLEVEVNVNPK